jgi:hypothetical protein
MDVATDKEQFQPRMAILESTGKGWVDFIRAIDAITLFGDTFGALLKPVNTKGLCHLWADVPIGNDCLSVCVSDIKEISRKKGVGTPNTY